MNWSTTTWRNQSKSYETEWYWCLVSFFLTCNLIMASAASPGSCSANSRVYACGWFCFQLYDSSSVNNFISVVPPENLARWNWCVGRVVDGFMHVALLQMLGEYSVTFLHLHLFSFCSWFCCCYLPFLHLFILVSCLLHVRIQWSNVLTDRLVSPSRSMRIKLLLYESNCRLISDDTK